MSAQFARARNHPTWTEVIVGALISVVLGVVLGALLMVLRPAEAVREIPKGDKFDPKAIYYVKGARDGAKAKVLQEKRAALVGGQSVTLTEDELNTLQPPTPPPGAPKAADPKAPAGAAPVADGLFAPGPVNFRIHDGSFQVAVPVAVNVLGASTEVIVQTRGKFVKSGEGFVLEPETFYAGSCPLQRLPFLSGLVRDKILLAQPIPDDLRTAWAKLANVSIEGNALKLTMP